MGYGKYSSVDREIRAAASGYYTKTRDEIFVQNQKRQIHESMDPSKALLREARDSEAHPNSFPIILALDVTGSMGHIPHELVKDGLPKIVSGIIQRSTPDPQLLFLAIGDHECDRYPLQVGQFECGDEEMDMWLTRTYIEGGGGGNAGESYLLAWYFAANHTVTDAWEKRKQKGIIFTIGDEPCLSGLPASALKEIMGDGGQTTLTDKNLLEMAQEKYDVYHLHILEGSAGQISIGYWKKLLGQNCIEVPDYTKVPDAIVDIVHRHASSITTNIIVDTPIHKPENGGDDIMNL